MEQLQQTLEQRVEAGNSYSIINDFYTFKCGKYYIENKDGYEGDTVSYHDLFSKDSGIMEFMEWRHKSFGYFSHNGWKSHIKEMGPMTAQEKILYFNTNAYLPGKQ